MSTRPTSSKSKSSSKPAAKKPAKAAAKPATASKSRLAGPKPPKARATSSTKKRVSAASVAAARDAKPSTSKIPAPPPPVQNATASVELKKPELIDLIVSRSDIKKKYAKPVVEAMLEVLAETVAKGREMNLQPFGKVKYNRTKETTWARVVVTKIRQNKPAKPRISTPKSTVADAAE